MVREALHGVLPDLKCPADVPAVPVQSAEIEQGMVVLWIQLQGPFVRRYRTVDIPDAFPGNGDLKPAPRVWLMRFRLRKQNGQRLGMPVEEVQRHPQAVAVFV